MLRLGMPIFQMKCSGAGGRNKPHDTSDTKPSVLREPESMKVARPERLELPTLWFEGTR
jgi:hypothetical protein